MADEWDAFPDAPAVANDPWAAFPDAPGGHPHHAPLPTGGLDLSTAADVAKSAGIGVVKGAIGIPGIAGDLQSLAGAYNPFDAMSRKYQELYPEQAAQNRALADKVGRTSDLGEIALPTSGDIQHGVEAVTGKLYEPQTKAGQYAQTAGEFLPNVAGGEAALAKKLATRVLAPAAASETAGQLTEGTALEPWARAGAGALVGGALAARDHLTAGNPTVPTVEELHDAAEQSYKNARGYGVEVGRQHVSRLADDIFADLGNDGFRERNIPKTWAAIDELKSPAGRHATIDDIDSVRKVLNRAGANPLEKAEREASRRAISAIDDYMATLDPRHVAVNRQFASQVGNEIGEARGNWAAMRRSELVNEKLEHADLQAASGGSGANINNAIRQKIKSIVFSPRLRRGFSAEELAQMERLIRGTTGGNAARLAGKLAPSGVVSGALSAGFGHAAFGPLGVAATWGGGLLTKALAEGSTRRQAQLLDEMVRGRSPLGKTLTQPSPSFAVPLMSTGLAGAIGARTGD